MLSKIPDDNFNHIIKYLDSQSFFKILLTCSYFYNYYKDFIVKNNKHRHFFLFYDVKMEESLYYKVNRYILGRNNDKFRYCLNTLPKNYNNYSQLIFFDDIDNSYNITLNNFGIHYLNKVNSEYVKYVLGNSHFFKKKLNQLLSYIDDYTKITPSQVKYHHQDYTWMIFNQYKVGRNNLTTIFDSDNNNRYKDIHFFQSHQEILDFCIDLLSKDSWWAKFIDFKKSNFSMKQYMKFLLKEATAKQRLIFNSLLIVKIPHYKILHHYVPNRRVNDSLYNYQIRSNEYKYKIITTINPDTGEHEDISAISLVYYLLDRELIQII